MFNFMQHVIEQLQQLGRARCSESYTSTLNSFKKFRNQKDVLLSEMDSGMIQAYEAYLKGKGLCPNSSSFYLRNLRAVYNRAVEKKLVKQQYPFKHVYTGIDKTVKRAIPLQTIKAIKNMDFRTDSSLDFARVTIIRVMRYGEF